MGFHTPGAAFEWQTVQTVKAIWTDAQAKRSSLPEDPELPDSSSRIIKRLGAENKRVPERLKETEHKYDKRRGEQRGCR